jgi:hypothetical protein
VTDAQTDEHTYRKTERRRKRVQYTITEVIQKKAHANKETMTDHYRERDKKINRKKYRDRQKHCEMQS